MDVVDSCSGCARGSTSRVLCPEISATLLGLTLSPHSPLQADVFGASDSGPFYKEDGPRFESYPGGVTWARGRGYSYVATGGLPGTKSEKNTLRALSDGLADSISQADLDHSKCVPL